MANAKAFAKGSESKKRERREARKWLYVAIDAPQRDDQLLDTIANILIKHSDRYGKDWEKLLRATAEAGSARACREYAHIAHGARMEWYSRAAEIERRQS